MLVNVAIIENSKESIDRVYDISISAKEELLVAFPTINSFRRNMHTGISMQLLNEEYSRNSVRLRIITPVDNQIMQIIEELKKVFFRLDVRALIESTESNSYLCLPSTMFGISSIARYSFFTTLLYASIFPCNCG